MTPRLLPYGPGGWLVEVEPGEVAGYAAAIRRARHPAVAEVVPGARTVLVCVEPPGVESVAALLRELPPEPVSAHNREEIVVPVTYDGEDLGAVAAACGMPATEVVARHSAGTYLCAFCGFAPGFAYLVGLDPALHVPRRATPRTRVLAGSVAIAAEYTAVYPSDSPGGWHLIGRTNVSMWDLSRSQPATIPPSTIVRFTAG